MTKMDKNQNPRWPPDTIMDFGFKVKTFEWLQLVTSNLAQG